MEVVLLIFLLIEQNILFGQEMFNVLFLLTNFRRLANQSKRRIMKKRIKLQFITTFCLVSQNRWVIQGLTCNLYHKFGLRQELKVSQSLSVCPYVCLLQNVLSSYFRSSRRLEANFKHQSIIKSIDCIWSHTVGA